MREPRSAEVSLMEMRSASAAVSRNYIGGEWIASSKATVNQSPSDLSDIIGEYAEAEAVDVKHAVDAARSAFHQWSRTTAAQRAEIMLRIARELEARQAELGELLSREEGKVRKEGINEVAKAGKVFEYFAAEIIRPDGEHFPSLREGIDVEAIREPLGVIAILTPWNLPMGTPCWKIAPALAFGNCVVFKPANFVPGSAWALTDIIARAGTPPGVFNLVMGPGTATGSALVSNPGINAITFTGSNATGSQIAKMAAERGVKLQMEMGGKNPLIVLDDADVDIAVDCALRGAFYATGQRCTASSRLIVTKGIHERFVASLVERMKAVNVDHALDPRTDIGPVVSEPQFERDLAYISLGVKEGAELRWGGDPLTRKTRGYYLAPALFVNTSNAMRINREEIFGPVASVIPANDYEEALSIANDTPFGLAAGICTTSMRHASHFKRNAECGICMINLPTAGSDMHAPFGGRKGSSYGSRELSVHAREFYTTVKTVYASPGA